MKSDKSAIERFLEHSQVEVNKTAVYATYTSGLYNGFYASEEEAIEHCRTYENGQEYRDSYTTFDAGDLFRVIGNGTVYYSGDRSRYIDGVAGDWQLPFVEWGSYAPKPVLSAVSV